MFVLPSTRSTAPQWFCGYQVPCRSVVLGKWGHAGSGLRNLPIKSQLSRKTRPPQFTVPLWRRQRCRPKVAPYVIIKNSCHSTMVNLESGSHFLRYSQGSKVRRWVIMRTDHGCARSVFTRYISQSVNLMLLTPAYSQWLGCGL